MNKNILIVVVPLTVALFVFVVFVPVISETQVVWANWGTLYNGLSSPAGDPPCPPNSLCTGQLVGFNIPSTVSISYYLWGFGGESLTGNMFVYQNGNITQNLIAGSTYMVVFNRPACATGFVCLYNSTDTTRTVSETQATTASSLAKNTTVSNTS